MRRDLALFRFRPPNRCYSSLSRKGSGVGIGIGIDGLTKSSGPQQIWEGVAFDLRAGEVTSALPGPLSTGKSVFLKSPIGLLRPERGTTRVAGTDVIECSVKELYEIRTIFGLMFRDGAFFGSMKFKDQFAGPASASSAQGTPGTRCSGERLRDNRCSINSATSGVKTPTNESAGHNTLEHDVTINKGIGWSTQGRGSIAALCTLTAIISGALLGTAALAHAVPGPEVEYTYDVMVRRHYDFPNNDAIGYGYSICDKVTRGEPYASLMAEVKSNVMPNDEQAANYVVSNAVGILCPAQIWQLRNSAAAYRPPA